MQLLEPEALEEKLALLQGWIGDMEMGMIQKEFTFKDFSDAMIFVNKVGEIAEEENHHPDICISYDNVVVMLTTHDAGGVTKKDTSMAERIEKLISLD